MPSQNSSKSQKRAGRRDRREPKKATGPKQLAMLTHGKDTNFPEWREAMRDKVALDYGILVSIIDDGLRQLPAEVDPDDYELGAEQDPHGINLMKMKARVNNREKVVAQCKSDEPKMRALMWRYMSRESQEAAVGHNVYFVD